MNTLPGFWHAAARMTGRIDLSMALQQLPTATSLASASHEQLAASGLHPARLQILKQTPSIEVDDPWICLDDAAYPETLRLLPYAPPVLFYQGDLACLEPWGLAIVGARRCTQAGMALTRRLSKAAVDAGLSVISGMAQGIDSAAHLAACGSTVAVLGQGLSHGMSWGRRRLADRILAQGGLLVTEFLPHFPASRWTFPQRNRVIAGLSQATLVVEATRRSGALITARHALDIGREVMAVPGSPCQPLAQGCLQLLRDGAGMVASVEDLQDALGLDSGAPAPVEGLVGLLEHGATLEELVQITGRSPSLLHAQLSTALLMGRVSRLPGDRYMSVQPD